MSSYGPLGWELIWCSECFRHYFTLVFAHKSAGLNSQGGSKQKPQAVAVSAAKVATIASCLPVLEVLCATPGAGLGTPHTAFVKRG